MLSLITLNAFIWYNCHLWPLWPLNGEQNHYRHTLQYEKRVDKAPENMLSLSGTVWWYCDTTRAPSPYNLCVLTANPKPQRCNSSQQQWSATLIQLMPAKCWQQQQQGGCEGSFGWMSFDNNSSLPQGGVNTEFMVLIR